MCGLYGMIGPGISVQDLNFIKDLAYISGLRGTDGSGVCQGGVYKKAIHWKTYKNKHSIDYFLWDVKTHKDHSDILDSTSDNFMLGHTRGASKGELSDENAHPFDVGDLVGTHNGTLHDKAYQHEKKTDSELMFEDMDARGISTVLKEIEAGGAFAVVVFNKRTGEIQFARNDKRTLYYCWNKDRRVFYYASEARMLYFAADRTHVKIGEVKSFAENVIYTLKPLDVESNGFPKWTARQIPAKPIVRHTPRNDLPPFNSAYERNVPLLIGPPAEQPPLPGFIINTPNGNVISLSDRKLIKNNHEKHANSLRVNCIYCQNEMDLYDQYKGTEIDIGTYSCESCDNINKEIAIQMESKHKGANSD